MTKSTDEMDPNVRKFLEAIEQENADRRNSAKRLIQAVQGDDVDELFYALHWAKDADGLHRGFRGIGRLAAVSKMAQEAFLQIWMEDGDLIRSEVCDDRVVMDALWVLLPRYDGPGLTLYRGDGMANRKHRSYGLSWTRERDVGLAYAASRRSRYTDGTVLLSTFAPPEAIICAPFLHDNRFEECEYVVDRRRLNKVSVEQRLSYKPE